MTTRLTDEQIEALRQKAIKWMHPITEEEVIALIDEIRDSRSSSGSGEREALEVGGAIVAWVEQELRAEDTEGTAACPGYPDKRELRSLIDRWRALSSAPPSPDSGDSETP